MYRILYGNDILHDPRDSGRILTDAKAELAVNEAGTLTFTVQPNHPMHGKLEPMNKDREVVLIQDGIELFRGRIRSIKDGFYGNHSVTCEGELSYLNDITLRPYSTTGSDVPSSCDGYFAWLVNEYNQRTEKKYRFTVGVNQAWELDPNNHILRENANRPNVAQEIKDKLLQKLGGYVRTRHANGLRYIDYLSSGDKASSQRIEFGENLLDFTRDRDWADYYNVIVPTGAASESEESEKIGIAGEADRELAGGLYKQGDRIIDVEGVSKYGYIERAVEFEDITIAENLVEAAARELRNVKVGYVLEMTAVDLHLIDPGIKPIYIGDFVRATSRPHGYDEYFICSRLTVNVSNPSENKFTLGNEYDYMTGRQSAKLAALNASINKVYEVTDNISAEAKAAANQAVIANATAEQAQAQADAAQTKADEAKEQADAAATAAGEATTAANDAKAEASTAYQSAIDAAAQAKAAESKANAIEATVTTMQTDVSNAQSAAEAAQQEAAQAVSKAAEAEEAVKSATDKANAAQAAAEAAQTAAGSATDKAEAAQTAAGEAKTQAADASTTAAAAKLDAEQAKADIASLGEELETVSNTMTADYARKTDLTEATASLQSQITQNAGQITSTVSKLAEVDETANDAKDKAEAAQSAASTAQSAADAAAADATAAQTKADEAAAAAATAQSNADTASAAAAAAQAKADEAAADLTEAEANLANVTSRVDSTEEEIAAAQQAVTDAQAAADKAQADADEAATKAANAQTTATNAATAASNAQTKANEAAEAAATAQETADKAQGDATAAKAAADQAAADAATAQSTADTAKANAATAQSKADQAAATAAAAQTAADEADAKAAQAAADLATAEQNLTDVTSRVDATEEEIEAAKVAVETAQAAADKAKLDAATAQSTADTAKTNAANAQTAANNAKAAADAAQADADAAKEAADKAQADVDALAVRVTTAETKITQNSEAIELRATKTEVTQTLGGYYTKSETEAKITEKADSITQSVSSTYATKTALSATDTKAANAATAAANAQNAANAAQADIDELEIGGRNYFIRSQINDLAWGSGNTILQNASYRGFSFPVVEGECWTYYRTDSTNNRWGLYWLDTEPALNVTTLSCAHRDDSHEPYTPVTVVVPAGITWGFLYLSNQADEIPNIKLEKGNRATDWTPAPEDVDADIDTAQATADHAEEVNAILEERVVMAESVIKQLSDCISMLVVDGTGASLMTQTDDGWQFSIGSIQDSLDKASSDLNSLTGTVGSMESAVGVLEAAVADLGEIAEYVTIGTYYNEETGNTEPCIELGESDSDFKLLITNTRIMFTEGSGTPTYIKDNTLVTNNVEIKDELRQSSPDVSGYWVWSTRSNGNYGLAWRE